MMVKVHITTIDGTVLDSFVAMDDPHLTPERLAALIREQMCVNTFDTVEEAKEVDEAERHSP